MRRWSLQIPEAVLASAIQGDSQALDQLARELLTPIYNLALRFLYEPQDAQDATQEATLRVLQGLPTFRGRSTFSTWAYRVVVRSLLNTKRSWAEELTVDAGVAALEAGLAPHAPGPEDALLVQEVKLSCTTALLVCLPRTQCLAYVLGDVMEMSGPEASAILEITPTAYRQRLAAARKTVRAFFRAQCGLLHPELPCRCERQVSYCVRVGFVKPQALRFADRGARHHEAMRAIDAALDTASLYHAHPEYLPPEGLRARVRACLSEALEGS